MFTMVNYCKQKGGEMSRVKKYGKPHASRFLIPIEKKLQKFCIDTEINESDVIQAGVECILTHKTCKAKRAILAKYMD